MNWLLLSLALSASLSETENASAAFSPPPVVAESVPAWKSVTFAAGAIGLMAVSAVGLGFLGTRLNSAYLQTEGHPSPLVNMGSFGLAAAINFAFAHVVVPQFVAVGNTESSSGKVEAARAEGWRRARWGFLASGISVATTLVGAGLEQTSFGSGQGVMLGGLVALMVSAVVTDVLEATGAWHGYLNSRSAR